MKHINSSLQKGSAHAIIIGVLFIALMATLGIVFYQNFIAKESENVSAPSTQETTKENKSVARVAFNSSIYALDHPSDWKAVTNKVVNSTTGASETKITSPNASVEVKFGVIEEPVDAAPCDSSDGRQISYYKVNSTKVTKLTDQTLQVVQAMYDKAGGGYSYVIGLVPDGGATHAAVGETYCNVQYVSVASSAIVGANKTLTQPTIFASIAFPKIDKNEAGIKEMQPVKDLLETNEYKQAVQILESARKE